MEPLSSISPPPPERPIGAQRLAQYVMRNRCQRHLRATLFPSEVNQLKERYGVSFESLSPLLSTEGQAFERRQIDELTTRGERVIDLTNKSAAEFFDQLNQQSPGRVYYYQPSLEGRIGAWPCGGRADLIEATRRVDESFSCVVVDIKASQRETVGFRLQVAFYAVLLEQHLRALNLEGEVRGAVVARDAEFAPGELRTFDLTLFKDEIMRLIAAPDSDVARAARADFETAQYHLGPHCDGCPYNAICFVNAAESEDLSLVPHLTATEKSALHAEGVRGVRELARLMRHGAQTMEPTPEFAADVRRLGARWPLGSRLPVLAQRARAALARRGETLEWRRTLYGSNWGSLPDPNQYPDLVKVFVDVQRDHVQDRVYLLAARIVGPRAAHQIVEISDAPPDTDAEQGLLVKWMQRVLPAVGGAADSASAPVHVYVYDGRGQRALLDALARHFAALCAIPAFYDLLTSTPALTQSMISFLGDEVRERQNLGAICPNLYEVAKSLGFQWRDGAVNVPQRFRARLFDNRRRFVRDEKSHRFQVANGEESGAKIEWVESAARFGAEIPLEYAYAAWGALAVDASAENTSADARAQMRSFLGTTVEDIKSVAARRLAALQHIEERFQYKNRRVEKQSLALERLDQVEVDPATVPLNRALEDFLRLEHYAALQERLLHFSLPPDLRAETGRTAILRCDDYDADRAQAAFTLTDIEGRELIGGDATNLRFREGDWLVLNPLADGESGEPPTGKRIVHGRLGVVEEVRGVREIRLSLKAMNFKNSSFRFGHRQLAPEPGALYTIDEMVDDFNADKLLAACRHAASNHLYGWLENAAHGQALREHLRPSRLRTSARIAEIAQQTQKPHGLTGAQRAVIGDYLAPRVLVLQGPPGTGKSHTLGFATLARALALATPSRPFRVAVCAKTHAAVGVALASIRARADELRAWQKQQGDPAADSSIIAPLERLKVYKLCNDASDDAPAGVERLLADGNQGETALGQWTRLMEESLLVVGCTPGGLYNLIKRGAARGRTIDWTAKYFDLVLVDEASQMGIAEALLTAAFLREDGQFIAIGDHRQMPPILAHAWDQESRRDLQRVRPYLSIFEYLRELGFASAALDESFRIPREVADFLRRHVYAADGVDFHSRNRERLKPVAATPSAAWIAAALAPDAPLVVIEHAEFGSQQENEFEAELIAALVRAAAAEFNLDAAHGLGIVVPHRAQKFLLHAKLPEYAEAIDTVERFQGNERDLIIVSATVSDREFAAVESEFLLEPRRFTVAVSRPRRKVIVVASRAVFDLMPADLDAYERASLWKHLRHEAEAHVLWQGEVNGHQVCVRTTGISDTSF